MTTSTGLTCRSAHHLDSLQLHLYRALVSIAVDCVPVFEVAQRRHLRSDRRSSSARHAIVPNSCGLLAFSVLGTRLWNSLPKLLLDTNHNTTSFGHSLKTFSSQSTSARAHYRLWRLCAIQIDVLLILTYLLAFRLFRPCILPQAAALGMIPARWGIDDPGRCDALLC